MVTAIVEPAHGTTPGAEGGEVMCVLDHEGRCLLSAAGAPLTVGQHLDALLSEMPEADGARLREAFELALTAGVATARLRLRVHATRRYTTWTRLEMEGTTHHRICFLTHKGGVATPDRDLLLDGIQELIDAGDTDYAVAVVDLPDFRRVVSGLGKRGADALLSDIGSRLREQLGSRASVQLIGRSEYGVVLRGVERDDVARGLMMEAQREAAKPYEVLGQQVVVRTAVGLASGRRAYSDASVVLSDAESASLRAVFRETSGSEVFQTAIRDEDRRLIELAGRLRGAAESEQLRAVYQPIVDLETGTITSFEALVRWTDVELGFVSPAEFIPIAEKLGWVRSIDQWMMRHALTEFASWSHSELTLSVNVSAKWADDPALVSSVEAVLKETGLAAHRLRVEVTETALVRNAEACARVLDGLKILGVQIAMDDFGTGFASLRQLAEMPLDVLKIDRSFVATMEESQRKQDMVRAVIAMAHQLGLSLVAEGIETQRQCDWLREMGCDYGQGYLFAKPLSAEDALSRLARS